jgi:hypothetical protein
VKDKTDARIVKSQVFVGGIGGYIFSYYLAGKKISADRIRNF